MKRTLFLLLGAAALHAQPPAPLFAPGERVLFQGDSITEMGRGRTEDPNHILGHGYAYLIAARFGAAYPERSVVFINRGVSGDTVADLAARWKADTLDMRPDVLSVLIGINNIYVSLKDGRPLAVAEVEGRYDKFLTEAGQTNPGMRIILGEPFTLPGARNQGHWDTWREAVGQLQAMTARIAERHHAALVHYQRTFDDALGRAPASYWIWDGIHPTTAGHQLMADEWQRVYADFVIPSAPAAGDNTAEIPRPKLEHDVYDWYARHLAVLELDKTQKPDVVLIGDSITHFWSGEPVSDIRNGPISWDRTFRGMSVLNLGFGWDRTQNVLWRLEHGQMDGLTPRAIILNIGTNNLTGTSNARTNTPAEIAQAIALICRKLHAMSPGSRIVVMGVFPRGREPASPLRAPIGATNALLPQALRDCRQVTFLDIGSRFITADGTLPAGLMPDGTHPSEAGYAIWGQAIIESGALSPP